MKISALGGEMPATRSTAVLTRPKSELEQIVLFVSKNNYSICDAELLANEELGT